MHELCPGLHIVIFSLIFCCEILNLFFWWDRPCKPPVSDFLYKTYCFITTNSMILLLIGFSINSVLSRIKMALQQRSKRLEFLTWILSCCPLRLPIAWPDHFLPTSPLTLWDNQTSWHFLPEQTLISVHKSNSENLALHIKRIFLSFFTYIVFFSFSFLWRVELVNIKPGSKWTRYSLDFEHSRVFSQ